MQWKASKDVPSAVGLFLPQARFAVIVETPSKRMLDITEINK
jgi:hypothetical protein